MNEASPPAQTPLRPRASYTSADQPLAAQPSAAQPLIVAIDGPAGAGKSTLAKRLAERFGLLNLETGAMYRAFALKALERDVATGDAVALDRLAAETVIELQPGAGANRVLLDGTEVTERLRTPEVTTAASEVSVHPAIRRWMVTLQRQLGARGNVVMEGRDIGTEVFPQAPVKIFLDASPEKRGERRFEQVQYVVEDGTEHQTAPKAVPKAMPEAVLREIRERDHRDRTRTNSPLRPAADAVVIDSTDLPLEAVVERAAALIEARLAR
jgi:cytidylate kinase